MSDFLLGIFELFVATWDFLSYGKKRISVLRRAYRHGGWQSGTGICLDNYCWVRVVDFQVI